jgi:hypothetical protein
MLAAEIRNNYHSFFGSFATPALNHILVDARAATNTTTTSRSTLSTTNKQEAQGSSNFHSFSLFLFLR